MKCTSCLHSVTDHRESPGLGRVVCYADGCECSALPAEYARTDDPTLNDADTAERVWQERFAHTSIREMNDTLNSLIGDTHTPAQVIALLMVRAAEEAALLAGSVERAGLGPWCPRCGYTMADGLHRTCPPNENEVRAAFGDA